MYTWNIYTLNMIMGKKDANLFKEKHFFFFFEFIDEHETTKFWFIIEIK